MYLYIDPDKCTGCGLCELACSFHHEKYFAPSLSRIGVLKNHQKGIFIPLNCTQCEEPICALTCPLGAITRNPKTGALEVNNDRCQGCKMCILVCPLGGIEFNKTRGIAVKCDLCDGEPECVKFCATGALEIIHDEQLTQIKKKKSFMRIAQKLKFLSGQIE